MEKENSFDTAAANYDHSFTNTTIGMAQRERVYHWLKSVNFYKNTSSIFEMNCGTGFDAEHFCQLGLEVVATDGSKKMIEYAKQVRSSKITFKHLPFSAINSETLSGEAVFSNFGGLNCLNHSDLKNLLNRISDVQEKGEQIALVIMPKYCLMEGLYMLFTFKWKRLFRRNTSKGVQVNVDGEQVTTFYHSPKQVKKMLGGYKINLKKPVAIYLPPSYLQPFFNRHPKFLTFLNNLEGIFGRLSFLAGWSDHYIIIAEKT